MYIIINYIIIFDYNYVYVLCYSTPISNFSRGSSCTFNKLLKILNIIILLLKNYKYYYLLNIKNQKLAFNNLKVIIFFLDVLYIILYYIIAVDWLNANIL